MGSLGRLLRRLLGRARIQRRSGRQLLRRRSRQRARSKIPSASGRQSRLSCGQTGVFRMEVKKEISHKEAQKSQKTLLCLLCLFVAILPAWAQRPPVAEDVFKNVQVLKGIPVDEFMNTMGVFSAALGMSCE